MKKRINILFVCLCIAALAAGLGRTLLAPKDINVYENRYANQVPALTLSGYLDGSFQDGVDSALMDQIPAAEGMKSLYNRSTSGFVKGTLEALSDRLGLEGSRYVSFGGLRLFGGDHITYWPRYVPSVQTELDAKIASLNATFARYPDVDFTLFYIEKDTDVDFETLEKTGLAEYLLGGLALPTEKTGVYPINDFAAFSQRFYRTDAHWNCYGSYDAYLQLHDLLGCEGAPLVPSGEAVKVSDTFSGKKASSVAGEGVFTEEFWAYPFDFPPMTVTINGEPAPDYGEQDAYLGGTAEGPVSYASFYGGDNGETILSTGTTGRGNLLVVGESYDNPLLKLLACHYDNLYSIDLRYYAYSMGRPFDFSGYLAEKGIDKVLLIGNIDYYIQDLFDLEN